MGKLWRKIGERTLRDAFGRMGAQQSFGSGARKTTRWKRQLAKADTSGVQQELRELGEMAEKLKRMADSPAKQRLRRELGRRLKTLADFSAAEMNSKSLTAALNRALAQLAMSESAKLAQNAMTGLGESLDVSALELQAMAQAMRDLEALENGLSALQNAKRLNELAQLDGQACGACKGIADYEALYGRLMGEAGKRKGGGMGNEGEGRGGQAPEDDSVETDFKSEKSKSALTAGKLLLQLKTREVSHPGVAREDYQQRVEQVRQGVSEAILHERVPPGYHEGIRRYFDALKDKAGAQGSSG